MRKVFRVGGYCLLLSGLFVQSIWALSIEDLGIFPLPAGTEKAHELSGISYVGPVATKINTYEFIAVTDTRPVVYTVHAAIDPETGRITSAQVTSSLELSAGGDTEGIAYDHSDGHFFIADEVGPTVRKFYRRDGQGFSAGDMAIQLEVPEVFKNIRPNLGFEGLALQAWGLSLWTANEEALTVDGEMASVEAGSPVRLLKYGPDLKPAGQWVYVTDPVGGRSPKNHPRERSGISGLTVLPDGRLLVLERMLDVERFLFVDLPHFISSIYFVDFDGATDVSDNTTGLKDADYQPVSKELLWRKSFTVESPNNFEGMTLGPRLLDGRWTLLLVSDDEQGKIDQSLYSLVLDMKSERLSPVDAVSRNTGWTGDVQGFLRYDSEKLKWFIEYPDSQIAQILLPRNNRARSGDEVLLHVRKTDEGLLDAMDVLVLKRAAGTDIEDPEE